jgi:S1-C subfamily serine protease
MIRESETQRPKLDEYGKQVYYCGFSVGGGIDQDPRLSPQKFPDKGIYVTTIKPGSPASKSNLKVHDKILQVNIFQAL